VGRGARSNDQLTFRESSPSDVWLHARDAAGAHVVLRWQRDEPPPARDLEEAALLAAWHSRARGSALVPVDWTRRKYVRKPRGARAGLVTMTRGETVFVRPTAAAERRLRAER
jgi:predicted ribosome quality control (RQC) complex YloA/Tae2 family protein